MTNKENCRYAVLSAVHDEGVSVGDAVDELYDHHMRPMEQQIVEKDAEIARLKGEITELTKHVQLTAEHKKDPIWAMIKAEMANHGYRMGYDQAMEKSHQLEDRLQKRSAEMEQLLGECIRLKYYDEAKASPSWLQAARKAAGVRDAEQEIERGS